MAGPNHPHLAKNVKLHFITPYLRASYNSTCKASRFICHLVLYSGQVSKSKLWRVNAALPPVYPNCEANNG